MQNQFERTEMLLGNEAMNKLKQAHVAVFGIGGVGSYVVEVLARSGVGAITLVDNDIVSISNINRQLVATLSTIGKKKVEVAQQHIKDINPDCQVHTYPIFYLPETAHQIDLSMCQYVVDCVDTVAAKIELIKQCKELNIPVISSMGAANKMNPTQFKVTDLYKTNIDPLAKILRKKLRALGIKQLKVVYSEELPLKPITTVLPEKQNEMPNSEKNTITPRPKRATPASNAFVPSCAGLILGSEVVKDLIDWKK